MSAKSPSPGATLAGERIEPLIDGRAIVFETGKPVDAAYLAGLIESLAVAPAVSAERQAVDGRLADMLDAEKARADRLDADLSTMAKAVLAEEAKSKRLAEALKITHGALLGLRDAFRIEGRSEYPTLNMAIDVAQAALEGTDGPDL